jgi:hypothetical protein
VESSGSVEAEQLTSLGLCLDHTVGEEGEPVAGLELKGGFGILSGCDNADG